MHTRNSPPIDLTHPLDPTTPVYPDYLPVAVEVLESTRHCRSDGCRALNSSRVSVGIHCGTHMDAPYHFFEEGRTIDQVALEQCIGLTILIDLSHAVQNGPIKVDHLRPHHAELQRLGKVVIDTGWSGKWGQPEYFSDHPVFTAEAARFLIDCEVHLVGVDCPSVDRPPFPAHVAFLGNGAVIVENLTNLKAIRNEVFRLVVVPLKLTGREGSPVRALALEV